MKHRQKNNWFCLRLHVLQFGEEMDDVGRHNKGSEYVDCNLRTRFTYDWSLFLFWREPWWLTHWWFGLKPENLNRSCLVLQVHKLTFSVFNHKDVRLSWTWTESFIWSNQKHGEEKTLNLCSWGGDLLGITAMVRHYVFIRWTDPWNHFSLSCCYSGYCSGKWDTPSVNVSRYIQDNKKCNLDNFLSPAEVIRNTR